MTLSVSALDPLLLVEDDPDDVFFFQRGAAAARLANPIEVARHADAAITWLANAASTAGSRLPVVTLLDLKMPGRSGFDVLMWIRAHSLVQMRHLPVVVFTSSKENPDVRRAYDLGASGYLVKPIGVDSLTEMVRGLGLFWAVLNTRDLVP
jgi:DNA-binding NarL/FixJ family response regulator